MKRLLSFVLIMFLLACQEEIFINGNYTRLISEKRLDSGIEFFPSEVYLSNSREKPALVFQFYTTWSYPCINYSIETSIFRENNELIVRFEGVSIDRICATAIGPASKRIELPESTEKLILMNGDKIDEYEIYITDERVVLIESNQSFSELKYSKIFRYPEKSFVYSSKKNSRHLVLYNAFLDSMQNHVNIGEFIFKGEGRIPYAENSENEVAKYFTYEDEADFYKAGDLFRNFVNQNSDPDDYIYIELINWKKEKYLSWMLYE